MDRSIPALTGQRVDPQVRAVVLTGTGRAAFCAGQDLSDPHIKPEFDESSGPAASADVHKKPKAKDIGNLLDHLDSIQGSPRFDRKLAAMLRRQAAQMEFVQRIIVADEQGDILQDSANMPPPP